MIHSFPQLSAEPRFCGRENWATQPSNHTEKIIMIRTWTRSIVLSAFLSASFYSASWHRACATDVIITLAGGGSVAGYKPDEANLALANVQGLAISPRGEIYFSDANHHQVLKVNPTTGLISLVAGNGARAYGG